MRILSAIKRRLKRLVKRRFPRVLSLYVAALLFLFRWFPSQAVAQRARVNEFRKARDLSKLGKATVDDLLLDIGLWRVNDVELRIKGILADAKVTHAGLRLSFKVPASYSVRAFTVYAGDMKLRSIAAATGGRYSRAEYVIRRETLRLLPKTFALYVGVEPLVEKVEVPFRIVINPHGIEQNDEPHLLGADKKGFPVLTPRRVKDLQAQQLKLYESVSKDLKEALGVDLFILYGTLLGCVRDGKLIEHDDDFDVGYISKGTRPEEVKKETAEVMKALVERGYYVSINFRWRAFCVWGKGVPHRCRLDVRPVWFEDGMMWAHLQACHKLDERHFLPLVARNLDGVEVLLPRHAEAFLEANYGPGWKVPDPEYSNAAVYVPEAVHEHLRKTCFTLKEVKQIYRSLPREIREKFVVKPLLDLRGYLALNE